ncbi:flavin monoamine oxidase family protein [Streptomyces asiaticus]
MQKYDAIVIGAGLAGLSAARDLANGGSEVVVLEARDRVGGRVEQVETPDGRKVQLGGEIVGTFHTAYKELVAELGLTMEPTFTASTGETSWVLSDGRHTGDPLPWMSASDRRIYDDIEHRFSKLAASVDPDDPWSHPAAAALDRISVAVWLRGEGATPGVIRALTLSQLALADESIECTSMLADLRRESAAGAEGFYNYDVWENERVLEGSATVALTMAEQLGDRIRCSSPVGAIRISPGRCEVMLTTGEVLTAANVVCAVPAGPLRDISISGISDTKLASLHRQKSALAAKFVAVYDHSFWEDAGLNGVAYMEHNILGGVWAQSAGIMSGLVPPQRIGTYLATPRQHLGQALIDEVVDAFGDAAATPAKTYTRSWGTDPWTQGYVTAWRPGDVMGVGPLHGKSEPPFYVCGSDQWLSGHMEGAVRTGRGVAREILASR